MTKKYALLFFMVVSAQSVCNDDDIILRFSDVFIPFKDDVKQRFTITVQADGESWVVNEAQCGEEMLVRKFAIDAGVIDFNTHLTGILNNQPNNFAGLNNCVVRMTDKAETLQDFGYVKEVDKKRFHVNLCVASQKEASLYNLYEKLCAVRDAQQELENSVALQKTILPGIYLPKSLCYTLVFYLLTNVFV